MVNSNRIKVIIGGEVYSLMSDESELNVQQSASYVDSSLKAITASGIHDFKKAAILVALQCANQVMKFEKDQKKYEQECQHVMHLLNDEIESLRSFS